MRDSVAEMGSRSMFPDAAGAVVLSFAAIEPYDHLLIIFTQPCIKQHDLKIYIYCEFDPFFLMY